MAITRRNFLGRTAAVLGAAGAASIGGSAVLGATVAPALPLTASELEALGSPMVLEIVDAEAGLFEILVGEAAVEFTDRTLVGNLAHTMKGASRHVVTS